MSTSAIKSLTTKGADRLLGMADQFFEDWEQNEGKDDPECMERRAEWDAIRPLLAAAPALLEPLKWMLEVADARNCNPKVRTVNLKFSRLTLEMWQERARTAIATAHSNGR